MRDAGPRRQVARNHQPLAQRLDVGIDDAELELLGGRHHRPAALRDDLLILADRLLDVGDGLRREDRQLGGDLLALARLGVEIVAPVAAAVGFQDVADDVGRDRIGAAVASCAKAALASEVDGDQACSGKEKAAGRVHQQSRRYLSRSVVGAEVRLGNLHRPVLTIHQP